MKVNSLLVFGGNCSEAIAFYQEVFCAQQVSVQTYGDNKEHLSHEHLKATDEWKEKVMHAHMELSNGCRVFLKDAAENQPFHLHGSDAVVLEFSKTADLEKVYHGLSEGGKVTVDLHKAFWHAMYAEVTDKFGKRWALNCQIASLD